MIAPGANGDGDDAPIDIAAPVETPRSTFLAIAAKGFKRHSTYRGATIAGLATNFFFGLLRAYVFIAVFAAAGRQVVAGYTEVKAVTYAAVTQALIAPVMIFGTYDLLRSVKSGEIAVELLRPVDLFGYWWAQDAGRAAFMFVGRGLALFALYPLLFRLVYPADAVHWLAFVAAVLLAVYISFCWRFLVNCASFWTSDALGVARLAFFVNLLLAGLILPLDFFPDAIRPWVTRLPFAMTVNTPAKLFVGAFEGAGAVTLLAWQMFWALGMTLVARAVLARGLRRLVVQGG